MKRYGMPYKGSKNSIAEWVVDILPEADNLYDLFAGGCAVTHCAMESGKWKNYILNDIEPDIVQLFMDAVSGKLANEERWISRETFEMFKDTDPYIRYAWSFGNNGRNYMYAPEVERFKKHLHFMFFAKTPEEAQTHWRAFVKEFDLVRKDIDRLTEQAERLCTECGIEMVRKKDGTIDAKKIKADALKSKTKDIREYMRNALKESGRTAADVDRLLGTNGMAGHYFGESQWALPTAEAYEKMQTIIPGLTIPWSELNEELQSLERLQSLQSLQSLESLERLQSLESLQRLQSLESLERLKGLEVHTGDYRDVNVKPNSVIYCDIPYVNTGGYGKGAFDHEAFYDWACQQDVPVYISEYWMPEDRFECIAERAKVCSYGTSRNSTIEKIFIPRR